MVVKYVLFQLLEAVNEYSVKNKHCDESDIRMIIFKMLDLIFKEHAKEVSS